MTSRRRKPGARHGSAEWRQRVSEGLLRFNAVRRERARVMPAEVLRVRETGTLADSLRALGLAEAAEVEAADLTDALGGGESLSAQRRLVIEDLVRVGLVMRGELARYLQSGDSDAGARVGTLAGQRRASLALLGLDARRDEVSLDEYLRQRGRPSGSDAESQRAEVVEAEPVAAPAPVEEAASESTAPDGSGAEAES